MPKLTSAITNQLKGDRIFSTGKLSLLKGFQLNAATSTQKLLSLTPKFTLLPKKQQIIIEMPEFHTSSFTVPDHAEKMIIEFVAYAIDFETETYEVAQTDELKLALDEIKYEACSVELDLNMENRVVIVLMGIKLLLNSASDTFVSVDKRFFAGSLQEIAYVKNGSIVSFVEPVIEISPTGVIKAVKRANWIKKD